jgi:hypothetical protein
VNTSTGANLPAENDGFTLQASSGQQSTLTTYFANKGWDPSWYPQINSEIAGTAPFFYFVSDGHGAYSLADGFQWGLGAHNQPLVIDDSYPAGIYTFTGNVNGSPVTVTLTVTRSIITFNGPHFGPPFVPVTGDPIIIDPASGTEVATGTRTVMMANIDNLDSHYSQSTLA